MATTIKLKNSVTTTNTPTSLAQGEVAINITDKKVWVGNAATTPIQLLGAGGSASFGALTCTSLTNSGLTSGQVTYATTAGLLTDSANLTFNGTTLTAAAITSTGVATFSAGTVSAPAITTTGDTNTGIFFPAADTIAFTEGGVESMRIDSSGNVGIGTTTPATPLQVNGTITATSLNTNNTFGFKNRIINGAMVIDQRNAGASVTITDTSSLTYTLDRWTAYGSAASKFSVQQNAGSVTPPNGFINYFGATSLSAYSVVSGDSFTIQQAIEGLNVSDLGWGTADAKTVTLSFWVRSSLTGTFGGSLRNSAVTRSYPFSYTISAANTWEYKTVTIVGDTSGTWLTTNGIGIRLCFSIGSGSTYSGTAGAWAATNYVTATGAVSVIGTLNATWYVTGVQLEVGSTATSFDYRPYGTELALCQRYYETIGSDAAGGLLAPQGYGTAGVQINQVLFYKVTKRASPTVTKVGTWTLINLTGQPNVFGAGVDNVLFYATATGTGGSYAQNSNAGNYVTISAEL